MKSGKSMKVLSVALAGSLLLSAQATAISAFAAPKSVKPVKVAANVTVTSNKPAALQAKMVDVHFNGNKVKMEVVEQSKGILVNAKAYATAIGATISYDSKTRSTTVKRDAASLVLKANDKFPFLNGAKRFISHAPRIVNNKLYVEIEYFTRLMGGEVITDEDGNKHFFAYRLMSGIVNPQWLNADHVIGSKVVGEGYEHYLININTRKTTKLNISVVTDHLVPSPDSKHVAYTDENSNVYVYTLETNTEKKITEDVSEKLELQWASDNSALFYIDGPSSNAIAKITLEGVITKIVDDKVNYKQDLFVHSNNTTFLYSVTKTGKTTADTTGVIEGEELPDFDVVIDETGTEPQLFIYDATAETPAPKALTSSTDNKTYSHLLADGTVVYLSTDTTDEEALTNIKMIDKDMNRTTIIVANTDVYTLKEIGGKLYGLGYSTDDEQYLYEINAAKGSAKRVASTPLEIINVHIGKATDQVLAEDSDGKLAVWKNNSWVPLTK